MPGSRRTHAVAGALILLVLAPASAGADMPQQTPGAAVALAAAGVRIDGAGPGAHAGYSVAAVGDVNGDGIGDLLIGAPGSGSNGRAGSGSAYVVFGRTTIGTVDLASLGSGGFRIDGAAAGDALGTSVAGAGDVNGDGLADLLIGAPGADPLGRLGAGAAYVVFGRPQTSAVDLAALGTRGYRIAGANPGAEAGTSVADAGDLNGDGIPDQAVGEPATSSLTPILGSVAVADGVRVDPNATAPVSVDLADAADTAYTVYGATPGDLFGSSIAALGDVTGDGEPDLLVGAPAAGAPDRPGAGAAYLVPGRHDGAASVVSTTTVREFLGANAGAAAGASVADVGDIDGDGVPDLAIGSWGADTQADAGAGTLDVFTHAATGPGLTDLASGPGSAGFEVRGASALDLTGWSVAGGGDVNADGIGDLVVGAYGASPGGAAMGGDATLLPGGPGLDGTTIDLAAHASGFESDGTALDGAGSSVAIADMNADGRPDVVVGAAGASPDGRIGAGSVYVELGFGPSSFSYPQGVAGRSRTNVPPVGPVVQARTGNTATFSIAPALPPGLAIDPATGVISGKTQDPLPQTTYTVTRTDLSGSSTAPVTVAIADATPPLLGLAFLDSKLSKVVTAKKARFSITLDEAGTLAVTVLAPKDPPKKKKVGEQVVIGTTTQPLPVGTTQVSVPLSVKARSLMRARVADGRLSSTVVTVVTTITDAAGNARWNSFAKRLAR